VRPSSPPCGEFHLSPCEAPAKPHFIKKRLRAGQILRSNSASIWRSEDAANSHEVLQASTCPNGTTLRKSPFCQPFLGLPVPSTGFHQQHTGQTIN
jgi:hypothetical protein